MGDEAELEYLVILNCSLLPDHCGRILQSLSVCRKLKYLCLCNNTVGNGAKHLSPSIRNWGGNPPIQRLCLCNCRSHEDDCAELLKSLTRCCDLTELNLSGNTIGEAARRLVECIQKLSNFSKLQRLYLSDCSLPDDHLAALLESLSSCKQLTCLDLSNNQIGNAGKHLAHSIKEWGVNPPLIVLYVKNCGLQDDNCAELLHSLLGCCNLEEVNLSGNTIGEASTLLVKVIDNCGRTQCLQKMYLRKCSIPEFEWGEILKSLGMCKAITFIDLAYNMLGKCVPELSHSIRQWGENPPLRELTLYGCSVPEDVCCELISALFSCKRLIRLELAGSHLCENGLHLKRYLEVITDTLESLCLDGCSIPVNVSIQIVSVLCRCKNLRHMSLPGNTLTATLSQMGPLTALDALDLSDATLNRDDLSHLTYLISSSKLPNLSILALMGNSLHNMKVETERLLDTCIKDHQRKLNVMICRNQFSEEFMEHWASRCEGTGITLDFVTDLEDYNDKL